MIASIISCYIIGFCITILYYFAPFYSYDENWYTWEVKFVKSLIWGPLFLIYFLKITFKSIKEMIKS